jgi:hypothetical protein
MACAALRLVERDLDNARPSGRTQVIFRWLAYRSSIPILLILLGCSRTSEGDAKRFLKFVEGDSISDSAAETRRKAGEALSFQEQDASWKGMWIHPKTKTILSSRDLECSERRLKYLLGIVTSAPVATTPDMMKKALGAPIMTHPELRLPMWRGKNGIIMADERGITFVRSQLEDYVEDPKQQTFPGMSEITSRIRDAGGQLLGRNRGYRNYEESQYALGADRYVMMQDSLEKFVGIYFHSPDGSVESVDRFLRTLALTHLRDRLSAIFTKRETTRKARQAGYAPTLVPFRGVEGNFGLQVGVHPGGETALFIGRRTVMDEWTCKPTTCATCPGPEGEAIWIE